MAKKLNVTPLHDRVIVKPAAAEEKTAGGIIIPDTAKEKPQRGTVIAAGPGKKDEPVTVKNGDTVLYGKYAGTEIQIEGEDEPFTAVFIRAPWITEAGPEVAILAEVDGHPVLAREGRILVASFHPELTDDTRVHERFLQLVREEQGVRA